MGGYGKPWLLLIKSTLKPVCHLLSVDCYPGTSPPYLSRISFAHSTFFYIKLTPLSFFQSSSCILLRYFFSQLFIIYTVGYKENNGRNGIADIGDINIYIRQRNSNHIHDGAN